jgi:hypothetical protein
MLFSSLAVATVLAADPSLSAVKLGPDNAFAKLLDAALNVAGDQGEPLAFGTAVTKKAVIDGALVTCVTTFLPSRAPEPLGSFQGCQIEEGAEPELGVPVLTFKELTLKLGGHPVLAVPTSVFCHTRAC